MKNKKIEMQAIFNELSERNKEIIILIAQSVKIAQEPTEQSGMYSSKIAQSYK